MNLGEAQRRASRAMNKYWKPLLRTYNEDNCLSPKQLAEKHRRRVKDVNRMKKLWAVAAAAP
jgi:hypothetical protein